MDLVKLETAFMWRCPACRTRNFEAAVDRELTKEDREFLIKTLGELKEDFELVGAPHVVRCMKCKEKYKTYDENDFPPLSSIG